MTTLIFVRHGEAEGNVQKIFHGWYDSSLTENGHRQAACTADYLADVPIDVLYASDLKRTMDTAGYIARKKHMDIHPDSRLREIFGGKWENVRWALLPEQFPEAYENWLTYPHKLTLPEGESMVEFQRRLVDAVEDIAARHAGERIGIVTHGTAIKALLCYFRKLPLSEFPFQKWCDNAAVTIVEAVGGAYTVTVDGYNAHLGDLSTLDKQTWWRGINDD